MLRRLLYILLFSLIFVQCSSHKEKFVVGVSQCSRDDWRTQMNNEILQEAMFYGDVEVKIRSAWSRTHEQIAHIHELVEEGVDLLIVSPINMDKITPIIERLYDSGIPVVVVDRKIASQKYTAFLGADNFEIGNMVGHHVVNLLGGEGRVIELLGSVGASAAIERHEGFMAAIDGVDGIELVCSENVGWTGGVSKIRTDSLLKIYNDVDLIFGCNDRVARGAYNAARWLGREEGIKFVGIDALVGEEQGVDLVVDGVLDASFLYPTGGHAIMQTAYKILNGEPFDKDTTLESTLIDSSNARVTMLQMKQVGMLDERIENLNVRIVDHEQSSRTQRFVLIMISLFATLLAVALFFIARMLRTKSAMNEKLERRNQEITQQKDQLVELSEQLNEATHAKLSFFTNISHDFRTPLTLIADPLEYLQTDVTLNDKQQSLLSLISRNVKILLTLIEQVLDFRRVESGKVTLNRSSIDLFGSIKEWTKAFMPAIEQSSKRIVLRSMPEVDYTICVDQQMIERVYYNLLSNAVKYSMGDALISVELSAKMVEEVSYLSLVLTNRCAPATKEHIDTIFDCFYTSSVNSKGSGIGLAITKSYVELHGGGVEARYLDDSGEFQISVLIPYNKEMPSNISNTTGIAEIFEIVSEKRLPLFDLESAIQGDDEVDKKLVLVVDDNEDIRQYICERLSSDYQLIDAADGLRGFELAKRYIPDLIISDIMMPIMDGVELCRELKHEVITCHIPVLMLTSCAEEEQRIEGYAEGADGYITKPFQFRMLHTRIKNLLENRSLISKQGGQSGNSRLQLRSSITTQEEKFMESFDTYINENLGNADLNVDDIAAAMCYSRVQLYRKVKAMSGESPNQLLRNARLRKGDLLLRTTESSVAEVAYLVGFTSPSYFSKSYKSLFGVSPAVHKQGGE